MEIFMTVAIGLATVFFGLISLILIIKLMEIIVSVFKKNEKAEPAKKTVVSEIATNDIPHDALVVVASAVIAEELGRDVSAIRISSIKKLN